MNAFSIIVNLFILMIFALGLKHTYQNFTQKVQYMEIINSLRNFTFFGSKKCGWSNRQLEDLNLDWNCKNFKIINCETQSDLCSQHNIKAFPTWISPSGQLYTGYRSPSDLKKMIIENSIKEIN